jgi:phenylpropionate dioxygenase-like ring-hydroxylating dioxygenase large terminal subunit
MTLDSPARPSPHAEHVLPLPRACTFDPADWQIIARYWYPVVLAAAVTEHPLGVTLLDQPLVVYRFDGQIVVADDLCPHRGMRLSLGKAFDDGLGIRCPLPRSPVRGRGQVRGDPRPSGRKDPNLRAYGAVERYGLLWTCLASLPGDSADGLASRCTSPTVAGSRS